MVGCLTVSEFCYVRVAYIRAFFSFSFFFWSETKTKIKKNFGQDPVSHFLAAEFSFKRASYILVLLYTLTLPPHVAETSTSLTWQPKGEEWEDWPSGKDIKPSSLIGNESRETLRRTWGGGGKRCACRCRHEVGGGHWQGAGHGQWQVGQQQRESICR